MMYEGTRKSPESLCRTPDEVERMITREPMPLTTGYGCPMCGGVGVFEGQLGYREHYRCRDCGWDYSMDTGSTLAD